MQKNFDFIVFTDTHLPVAKNDRVFEEFLETINISEKLTRRIIFLGDVFEVWSGVSKYNHERGKKLLQHIKDLKKDKEVYLVEGNWDFFLCRHFPNHFTKCTSRELKFNINGKTLVFTHGHRYNDWQTKALHFILTNPISYLAWKTELLKPIEEKVAKIFLNKETNPLPDNFNPEMIAKRLKNKFKDADSIFVGHFHREHFTTKVFFLRDYASSGVFYGIKETKLQPLKLENGAIKKAGAGPAMGKTIKSIRQV